MAWNEFYMQSGGDNCNAGSTTNNAASVTVTNGAWLQTDKVYTAPSGTPFASVSVGEWASIYLDGATATQFVGKIASKTDTTLTMDPIFGIGFSPSELPSGITCKIGGAWADFGLFASFSDPELFIPMRINMKSGTYDLGTTSRTASFVGSNTKAFELRGYDVTPGDLDNNVASLNRPVITATTGIATFTCTFGTIRNLSFTGNRSIPNVALSTNTSMDNCYIEQTNTTAAATAGCLTVNSGCHVTRCWLVAQNTSQSAVNALTSNFVLAGSYIDKGRVRISTGTHVIANNMFMNCDIGVDITGATTSTVIYGNTFVVISAAISFASLSATVTQPRVWFNNLIVSNSVGLEMNALTANAYITRLFNCYYTVGADEEVFTDWPSIGKVTALSNPVDSTGVPTRTTNARNAGFPGKFQTGTNTSYPDIGAVNLNATSTGMIRSDMSGNMFG